VKLAMSKKQSYYIQTDLIFLFSLFVITSLLAIYSAQQLEQYDGQNFVIRQIIWFAVGVLIVAAMQFMDLEQLYKASIYFYVAGVVLLFLLLISPESIARTINGAKSWFTLPGLSLQPAEFAKITTILYTGVVISKHREKYVLKTAKTDFLLIAKIIAVTMLPVLLIMQQPDFGTAMVYIAVGGIMIVISGVSWKIILSLVAGIGAFASGLLFLIVNFPNFAQTTLGIQQYQINRILTWFDPTQVSSDATFHFDRALMALGSGQLFGKGMEGAEVYYPEAQTDFIFSIIGESYGFIGGAFVIFLYFMLMYKLVTLGLSIYKHSPFAGFFCFGFLSMMFIHIFQNIGMTLGIMPITGIPLLLISYGGSSVLSTMFGLGIVYRIAVEQSIQNDYLFK